MIWKQKIPVFHWTYWYFNKCLRITSHEGYIRLPASWAKDWRIPDIRHSVFVMKFINELMYQWVIPILIHRPTTHNGTKQISNFKIITNQINTLFRHYKILFYIIFSQMFFCSVQNIMYSLFIFHIPLDL